MARYTYRNSDLWRERSSVLEDELAQLVQYLHSSRLDDEFDVEVHTYRHESGDVWSFPPEMSDRQLFAITLILSSSTLEFENKLIRFTHPPEPEFVHE